MCATLRLHLLAAGVLAVVSIPAPAFAQSVAHSFAELASMVSVGQTITVTDAPGAEIKGRVAQLSPRSLTLAFDAATRDFAESEVRLIQQKRPDSLLNGTLIGAAVGAGVPLVLVAAFCAADEGDCDWDGEAAALIAVYAGVGAGIGALVDYGVKGNKTVFLPGDATKTSVRIAPLLDHGQRGVRVSVRF
jgi:hypothetical protein